MQLNIPGKFESLIKARAQAAGFEDRVDEYLVRLVAQDVEAGQSTLSAMDLMNSSSEEISNLMDDGYTSGIVGEMDKAYFDRLRSDIRQQEPGSQTQG